MATRNGLDFRNGGNAGQRFAPEAQGDDRVEVGAGGKLGRRVTLEGQRQLVGLDAAAVIDHPDQVDATVVSFDLDATSAGIEGVLDELYDDGRWTASHLAGGDAAGNFGREDTNRQAGRSLARTARHRVGKQLLTK